RNRLPRPGGRRHRRTHPGELLPALYDTDPDCPGVLLKVGTEGADHQVIVATELNNTPVDVQQLAPMIANTQDTLGAMPARWSADAGYCSATNLEHVKDLEAGGATEFFISTRRMKHDQPIPESPRGRIRADATPAERMARKLKTKKGRAVYARRKAIVEPVFGQLDTRQGKYVLLRGLQKASREWNLMAGCHNLLKLFSYRTATA
ncbi:transposase, partial [Georgenia sp.]